MACNGMVCHDWQHVKRHVRELAWASRVIFGIEHVGVAWLLVAEAMGGCFHGEQNMDRQASTTSHARRRLIGGLAYQILPQPGPRVATLRAWGCRFCSRMQLHV